ncbi:MAG: hypothetical protein ACLQFW_21450 [Xanthobacteraceae bacterium]
MSKKPRKCKDCDATTVSSSPHRQGWQWLDIVDGADIANGWRCPACVSGWREIVERGAVELH